VLACHRIRSRQRHLTDDMAVLRVLATLAGQLLQLEQLVAEQTRPARSPQRGAGAGAEHQHARATA
jgi:Nif-specific regulatory protein